MLWRMASGYGYRSWWTGRTVRLTAGLVLLVGVVRLGWGWQAGRMLAGQVEAMRARGEPAAVEDFVVTRVPDAANAYEYQMQAAEAHVARADSPRNSNLEYPDYPPYTPEWHQLAELSEQKHGRVFALARQARQFDQVQTHQRYTSPMFAVMLPTLNDSRQLASTLADGAIYQHLQGNDGEAVERLRDTLHLSRSVRQHDLLVPQLVALGIDVLTFNSIESIAPELKIQVTSGAGSNAATRQQVCELIDYLLDDRDAWAGFERAIRAERVEFTDYSQWLAKDTWCVRPLADMQNTRTFANMDDLVAAAKRRDWPDIEPTLRKYDRAQYREMFHQFSGSSPRYSRFFTESVGYERTFQMQYRSIAERRMVAVSLAVRLFRIDHGKWPATLDQLVPTYVPAIPRDPFHNDARPIGYRIVSAGLPDGKDRPLLYTDAGPENPESIRREPMYSWTDNPQRGHKPMRQFRDLSRFVPPPLPAEAVDDDPAKPEAPGNDPQKDDHPTKP